MKSLILLLVSFGLVWSLYLEKDNETSICSFVVPDNECLHQCIKGLVVIEASSTVFTRKSISMMRNENFCMTAHICRGNIYSDVFKIRSATECKPEMLLFSKETLFIGCGNRIAAISGFVVKIVSNGSGEVTSPTPALTGIDTEDDAETDPGFDLDIICYTLMMFAVLVVLLWLYKLFCLISSFLVSLTGKVDVKYGRRCRKMDVLTMNSKTLAQMFGLFGQETSIYLKEPDARVFLREPNGTFFVPLTRHAYYVKLLPNVTCSRGPNANTLGRKCIEIASKDKLKNALQDLKTALLVSFRCPMCRRIATKPQFMKCCGHIGGCLSCFKEMMQGCTRAKECPVCTARIVPNPVDRLYYKTLSGLDDLLTLIAQENALQDERVNSPLIAHQSHVRQLLRTAQRAFRCSVCRRTATPPICFLSNCSHIGGCIRCFNNYRRPNGVHHYCGVCNRKACPYSMYILKGLDGILEALHTLKMELRN